MISKILLNGMQLFQSDQGDRMEQFEHGVLVH